MANIENEARDLTRQITRMTKDTYRSEDLIAKLEKDFTQHFNELAHPIDDEGRNAFGRANFNTILGNLGPLIKAKVNIFERVSADLKDSNVRELLLAGEELKLLSVNLTRFKNMLFVHHNFQTADQALMFLQDQIVTPFRKRFFEHLEKEKQTLGESLRLQYANP